MLTIGTKPGVYGAWILFCFLLLAGCNSGPNDTPELGEVTGTVKLDGAPLAGATVEFRPTPAGRPSTGVTDESGKYSLVYAYGKNGAKIGQHTVLITTTNITKPELKEKLPEIYHSKTTLTANVQAGKNEINYDLKSK